MLTLLTTLGLLRARRACRDGEMARLLKRARVEALLRDIAEPAPVRAR